MRIVRANDFGVGYMPDGNLIFVPGADGQYHLVAASPFSAGDYDILL